MPGNVYLWHCFAGIWDRADYLGWTDRTFDLSQMWPQQVALSCLCEREAPAERNGHGK